MTRMRGEDRGPETMFSYVSAEQRVPKEHPLRTIRALVDDVLRDMSREFDGLYARVGRPSIPPERLLRAQLLQIFYSIRSERLLMEQLDYNLLFRWFVGMDMDEPIWDPTVFTKNRDPDARLYRKSNGAESRLAYLGHLLIENRHGLIADAMATLADGFGEREAATLMMHDQWQREPWRDRTLGADKAYDSVDFVDLMRELNTTPHVTQNLARPGGNAIDGRTTRHEGYAMSQHARPRIEPAFGWLKTIAWMRKVRLRGLPNVDWLFVFASAAFNLIRLPKLLARPA